MTKFSDLPAKTLLRVDEVACFLAISRQTVYNWFDAGKLRGTKMAGKSLRIYRDSVLKLIRIR